MTASQEPRLHENMQPFEEPIFELPMNDKNDNPVLPVRGSQLSLTPALLHDLRSPLNVIIGYSEVLAEDAGIAALPNLISDLDKIRSAGKKLLDILNNNFSAYNSATVTASDQSGPLSDLRSAPIGSGMQSALITEAPRDHNSTVVSSECVLVVDDNEANRDVLSRRLIRQGLVVETATNGREAMEMLRLKPFDLILLDIMMPDVDGYEVLRDIKSREALCDVPVVMISALHEVDSVVRCIELGADDYLPKPFQPELLKARVGACLGKKRARDRERLLFDQLQQNYSRLLELEKQRDDLTRMIVHDLRTPLSSIIAGLHTIDVVGELNDDQREMVDIAMSGGETLLGMINTLLDVEKLESGSMHLDYTAVSPTHLVTTAIGQISSLAAEKQLNIVPIVQPDLSPIHCDNNKIIRTMVNLIGNAIKFTPFGGTVTIGIRHDEDNTHALISVTDTGEGIPPDAFELIFQKFGQVASRKGGRTMSTGLGLTFCKLAVEAHGGKIWVESTPGHGSTFTFNIPNSKQ